MPLADVIFKLFGVKTSYSVNPLTSLVGTSATLLLGNNPNRLAWMIVNLSANDVFIGFDRLVSSTRGIRLSPNGGSATFLYDEAFEVVGYEVYGIASLSSAVYVFEVFEVK